MAKKSNKDKDLSWRKGAKGKKPWPNLPQQILSRISRQLELLENISIPGTIKALRLPSRRCQLSTRNPQMAELVDVGISDWSAQQETTKRYINIQHRDQYYVRSHWDWYKHTHPEFQSPENMASHIVGCGSGIVVVRRRSPSKYVAVFRKLDHQHWWEIPDWDVTIPFKFALINELPIPPFNFSGWHLVFTGVSSPAFAFFLRGENVWSHRDCTIIDPNDPKHQFMGFGTAIACQGKIYALSMQGTIAVVEVIGSDFAITSIGKSRAVPSVHAKYFREYLVESNGEILLVFLIFQKSLDKVDQVEVYRLEVPKLRWVKMEELGDRALFVEPESCIWVKASEVGCQSNCVFFSSTIDDWWTYDLKSGTISSGWSKIDLAYGLC